MSEKENVQDGELNNVSGGAFIDPRGNATCCIQCATWFSRTEVEEKQIKDGCSSYYVYKCPGCGSWVKSSGHVYNS